MSIYYLRSFCLCLILAFSPSLRAANYYVRTDGNNANAGTSDTAGGAWLTVQKAATTMVAGDTVNIRPGTYSEHVVPANNGSNGSPITYQGTGYISGVIDTTIIVGSFEIAKAYTNLRGFRCNGYGATYALLFYTAGGSNCNASYLELEAVAGGSDGLGGDLRNVYVYYVSPPSDDTFHGLRILNPQNTGVAVSGDRHIIENCLFTGTGKGLTNDNDAIRANGDGIIVRNNTFDSWLKSPGSSGHVDIFQTFSVFGQSYYCTNFLFENNLVINCPDCQIFYIEDQSLVDLVRYLTFRNNIYVNVGGAGQTHAKDTYVYNNTFYSCGQNTGSPLLFRGDATHNYADNGQVFNNIFIECGANPASPINGWYGLDNVTNFSGDYNLVIGTGAGTSKTGFVTGGLETHGINGYDPLLNASWQPTVGSPVIGKGTDLSATFTDDYAGNIRTVPWDMGAYKYTGDSLHTAIIGGAVKFGGSSSLH